MASIVYMRAWQARDENASFNALCSITKKYSKFDAVAPDYDNSRASTIVYIKKKS